jgi:hypothetical protein
MVDRGALRNVVALRSVLPCGSWCVRSAEAMSVEDYGQYFDRFDPAPDWAVKWARLAKEAGARICCIIIRPPERWYLLWCSYLVFLHRRLDYSSKI